VKAFYVSNPLFKTETLFVFGCTHEKLARYIKRKFGIRVTAVEGLDGSMLKFDRFPWFVIWLRQLPVDSITLGVLFHEIFHLVTEICGDVDIPIIHHIDSGARGDEAAAYMCEFFTRESLRRLDRC
jgi:hypothetical protein